MVDSANIDNGGGSEKTFQRRSGISNNGEVRLYLYEAL